MKRANRKTIDDPDLSREFDFSKAVRGRYAGKFNRSTRITLRGRSGRIVRVTTVGEALSSRLARSAKPARSAAKTQERTKATPKSRSAD